MLKQGLDSGLISELSDMLCHSLQTGFTPQSPLQLPQQRPRVTLESHGKQIRETDEIGEDEKE